MTPFDLQDMDFSAGPVRALWQPQTTFLRRIQVGDSEALRGIYIALRDENWGTLPPVIENYQCQIDGQTTRIQFDVRWKTGTVDFRGHVDLAGEADGSLTYGFQGRSHSTFLTNRIGFLVLHGPDVVGKPVRVRTVDGHESIGQFPQLIAPHQPFFNLRSLAHEVKPGVTVCVEMEGDTFEMEDQRNWTDASFKTYSTPLALPFPVTMQPGDSVGQRIRVTFEGEMPEVKSCVTDSEVVLRRDSRGEGFPIPSIGLELPRGHAEESWTRNERERLRMIRPDHLRVAIHLSEPGFSKQWFSALSKAADLACGLEVALFLSPGRELESLDDLMAAAEPASDQRVSRWLVFHEKEPVTHPKWVSQVRNALRKAGLEGEVGGGTDCFFTELNREQKKVEGSDFVTFSLNPQVHAFDDLSLMETLEMQHACVCSARAFSGKRPIIVSPVTLKMRSNPDATASPSHESEAVFPVQADRRQALPFGAVWTLGCLKYLIEAQVASVTLFEPLGCLGVMERDAGTPFPCSFPSQPGEPFPLFHAICLFTQWKGGRMRPFHTSDPLGAIGFELISQDGAVECEVVANLTSRPQPVRLEKSVQILDPYTFMKLPGEEGETAV